MIRAVILSLSALALSGCVVVDNSGDRIAAPFQADAGASVETLPASELQQLVAGGEVILIDVRTPNEYAGGRIAGALNSPVQTFNPVAIPRDATRETILYCHSSGRSKRAAEMLAKEWNVKVRHLEGGIVAWKETGLPIIEN